MWPFSSGLRTVLCPVHNLNIIVYPAGKEALFPDDNSREVAIFVDATGHMTLKRFVEGQCDCNCETVKNIMTKS